MESRGKEDGPDGEGTDKPTLWSKWQTQRSQARMETLGGLGDRTALWPRALGAETGAVARVGLSVPETRNAACGWWCLE